MRLHKKALGVMQIVSMTGSIYPAVRTCIDLFDAGGWPAICPALRGRAAKAGRTLPQIELFYLSSCSPQLNPEERLNADLKREMDKKVPARTKSKLREAANEHMAMLDRTSAQVIGYFQDRRVRYAA